MDLVTQLKAKKATYVISHTEVILNKYLSHEQRIIRSHPRIALTDEYVLNHKVQRCDHLIPLVTINSLKIIKLRKYQ